MRTPEADCEMKSKTREGLDKRRVNRGRSARDDNERRTRVLFELTEAQLESLRDEQEIEFRQVE